MKPVPLGNALLELRTGPFGSLLHKADYVTGGIPLVNPMHISGGRVCVDQEYSVSARKAAQLSSYMLKPGHIVMGRRGEIGRCAVISESDGDLLCGTGSMILVPNPTIIDSYYLAHLIQTPRARKFLESEASGATMLNLNPSAAAKLPVPLPSLQEQKRIASILDQADELRRKRRRAIDHLNQLGQAIFHEMFGDPATNPKGFEALPLGDAVEFIGGSQPAKSHFLYEDGPDRVRFVQIRDFRTDKYPTWVPKALAKRPFTEEDVMVGRYGPPVFQIFRGLSGTYNVALMKAKPKLHLTSDFVFYLLQEPKLHSFVVANSERTAGQSGVNLDLLEKYPAYAPPAALLREFSDRIADVNSQARAHREASMAAERLFASLQHRAFRGEL